MVKWKYINCFTTYIYTFRVSKHIIGQSTNINDFSDFCLSSNWVREWCIKYLGIKEKCPQSYLSYFRRGSTGESFFFHGLIDFVLFLVLAWGTRVSHISVILLSSTRSKWLWFDCHEPCSKTDFLSFTSAEGKGAPLPFWGPSQSFGFSLFLLPMSGDLRSLSANICLSPLWPTFLPNGHLFDGLILSIQWEDSINSLTSSSPWAITWQYQKYSPESLKIQSKWTCMCKHILNFHWHVTYI